MDDTVTRIHKALIARDFEKVGNILNAMVDDDDEGNPVTEADGLLFELAKFFFGEAMDAKGKPS